MEGPRDPRIEDVQEQLNELAALLSDISSQMRKIADQRRGGLPEFEQSSRKAVFEELRPLFDEEQVKRAKQVSKKPTSLDRDCGVPQIRYAQYVEFTNADELLKFKNMPSIDTVEIEDVDWTDLERRLAETDPPEAA